MLLRRTERLFRHFVKQLSSSTSTNISTSAPTTSEDLQVAFQKIATEKPRSESDERFVQRYFYAKRSAKRPLTGKLLAEITSVARKYQLYKDGFKVLNAGFDSKGGVPLLRESALFIADYCAHCQQHDPLIGELLKKVDSVFQAMKLPSILGDPIEVALNYSRMMLELDASPPNKELLNQNGKDARSQLYLAFHHLELATRATNFEDFLKNWKAFTEFFIFRKYPIFEMPLVFFNLLKAAVSTDQNEALKRKPLVGNWLYEQLILGEKPLSSESWPMLQAFNNCLGFDTATVNIDEKRRIIGEKEVMKLIEPSSLSLPLSKLDEKNLENCRENFNKLLSIRKKSQSSIASKELSWVQNQINDLKRTHLGGKFLIVDTLNAFQIGQGAAQVKVIENFLKQLRQEFESILLITRRHGVPFLRNFVRNDARVRLMYGSDFTEDDILLLSAALEIGSSAWMLSNDRFQRYIQWNYESFGRAAGDSFAKWVEGRSIRHSPPDSFDKMAGFNRDVRDLESTDSSKNVVFVPVMTETYSIPKFIYTVVILPTLKC